jgi:hypothetical protein
MSGADVPGAVISMLPQALNLIPPHYMTKIALGDNSATVHLVDAGGDVNRAWLLMKLLLEYTPIGLPSTLYSLAQALVDETTAFASCSSGSNWIGRIGCAAAYAGKVALSFAKAAIALNRESLDLLLGVIDLAIWSNAAVGDRLAIAHGTKQFTVGAKPLPQPSAATDPPARAPTVIPPKSGTSSVPPVSSAGSQNPPFTGGYVVNDAFFGGTWPRTDPNDGTWYPKSTRPANGASYWWANGLGVGFSCGAHAASYTVNFADGHHETWNTWFRSTDTWGGRVTGLWVPSAVADGIVSDGIPPSMPTC